MIFIKSFSILWFSTHITSFNFDKKEIQSWFMCWCHTFIWPQSILKNVENDFHFRESQCTKVPPQNQRMPLLIYFLELPIPTRAKPSSEGLRRRISITRIIIVSIYYYKGTRIVLQSLFWKCQLELFLFHHVIAV